MRKTIVCFYVLFVASGSFVGCGVDSPQVKEKAVLASSDENGPSIGNLKSCYWWQKKRSCPNREHKEVQKKQCPDGTTILCTRKVVSKKGQLSQDRCMCLYEKIEIGKWDCPQTCKTVVQTPEEGQNNNGLRP